MSTTSDPAHRTEAPRTAAEVNEDIRALWTRAGGRLSTEQRREYQRLVMEWSEARQRPPARGPRPATLPRPTRAAPASTAAATGSEPHAA